MATANLYAGWIAILVGLVAVSSFSAQIQEAYELADRYRAESVPVVLGGLHVTALPEEAAGHCDAVVVGEGESVWREVLRDAELGNLEPYYRADGEFPLAEAPMPAFDLLDMPKYNRLTLQASRGCPFQCQFCASSILLTGRYKQKPVDRVLAEVDRICELWQRPFLEFADDNAFVSKRYWKELLYDGQWERCTLFDINYRPQPMTVDELRAGFHRLAVELYSDEITKWRRENFNRKYLCASKHSSEKAT
ncbi:MAG: cobalamin-dependent protein [Planctomycetota bacterium]